MLSEVYRLSDASSPDVMGDSTWGNLRAFTLGMLVYYWSMGVSCIHIYYTLFIELPKSWIGI